MSHKIALPLPARSSKSAPFTRKSHRFKSDRNTQNFIPVRFAGYPPRPIERALGPWTGKRSALNVLSAAQPQPNDRGEIRAFVASSALCRAALKGATSSPNGEMRAGSVAEKFEGKSLEARADLQFPRRLSNILLDCKGRTLVTN